ncbi:helix-turn-helix domain-containing protein [Ideonella sp.]|uniref:AraC family transcriptional regulator n=1 Tax=Ideonella sp. TaxID=1929293 RepID=UPI0035B15F46
MDASLIGALDLLVRGALVALLLMLTAALWRERPVPLAAQAGGLLGLGLALATLGTAPALALQLTPLGRSPWVGLASGNALLFALFARALFDDAARWRVWHGLAWGALVVLAAARCAGAWPGGPAEVVTAEVVLTQVLRWVPLVCVAWVVAAALAHWRDDLVERRRRLRWFVVVAGSVYTLGMLGVRWASPQGVLSAAWAGVDSVWLLAIVAALAASLLRLRPSELFASLAPAPRPTTETPPPAPSEPKPPPTVDPTEQADQALAEALQTLMATERPHRSEGLTLATLAQRLGVPEYRLRRVINQRLGHRNFSAFANGHRLAEAKAALADPARRTLPVLTIALDAGFQSIGPFNRAFKADTGLTPTEFRQQALAES